ncbi:Sua5 family C-terminal domain-containing protein, partial [Hydrotalea sp.]|uniref:Sua5 family C-terminal domain-containing protein n=1 Tax=Hydrotalea sp. TaxID=2881279 RepID=UPI002612270E
IMKSSSCIYLVPHSAVFNAHEVPEFDTFGKDNSSNLYSALHRLDKLRLDVIIAERFPDAGLGKTINDKLERTSK